MKQIFLGSDQNYMSTLHIAYCHETPLKSLASLMEDYTFEWDNIAYLVRDVVWRNVENMEKHPMHYLAEDMDLLNNGLAERIEKSVALARFAYFATSISHLWYDKQLFEETGEYCLHKRGKIVAFCAPDKAIPFIWINLGDTGPHLVSHSIEDRDVPFRFELIRDGFQPLKQSFSLKESQVFSTIRGPFFIMHADDSEFCATEGIAGRSFMAILTRGETHTFCGAYYNNGANATVESYPVSMHPLMIE